MIGSAERMRRIRSHDISFVVEPMDRGQREFWDRFEAGSWEPETLSILQSHLDERTTFVDIGAWIGPTSLFAAHYARRVIALEPDPLAVRQLRRNKSFNPELAARIVVFDRALYTKPGVVTLGSRKRGGDSKSSTVHDTAETTWEVTTVTPSELAGTLQSEERVFLKIDIEGGEYAVVPQMRTLLRPATRAVLLSLHPKILIGRRRGFKRLDRQIDVARQTKQIFAMFKGWQIHEARMPGPRRRHDLELLARWGLCYWPLTGTWLFTRE